MFSHWSVEATDRKCKAPFNYDVELGQLFWQPEVWWPILLVELKTKVCTQAFPLVAPVLWNTRCFKIWCCCCKFAMHIYLLLNAAYNSCIYFPGVPVSLSFLPWQVFVRLLYLEIKSEAIEEHPDPFLDSLRSYFKRAPILSWEINKWAHPIALIRNFIVAQRRLWGPIDYTGKSMLKKKLELCDLSHHPWMEL